MKFTAEFDSVNSADIAASAIRRCISDFSDICVSDEHAKQKIRSDLFLFPAYNPSYSDPMYTAPIFVSDRFEPNSRNEVSLRHHPTLEVICRNESSKSVSSLIIGYGGRNITVSE